MAADLDRAYIINGGDLMRALLLEDVKLVDEHGDGGRPVHAGSIRYADNVARDVLEKIGKPLGETRWPMTRGELETRLSLALDGKDILVDRDPAPGGERDYVRVLNPVGLARELVNAVDAQGDDDCQDLLTAPRGCCCAFPKGPHAELCPDAEPDAGIAALGICHGALTDLGDPVIVRRIIRYLADEFDVETFPG